MPALEGGAALPVTTGGEGLVDGRKAAVPVYVATDGPAVGQRARRVVVVTDGPVEGGAAIPVYDVGADALYSSEAALPVYVVSGSLGAGSVVTPPPANTVLPAISGTAVSGQALSTTDGTWTGTAPIVYAYQWKRGGVDIGGATANTYLLTDSDNGATITVTVTATNAGGSTPATSAGVAALAFLLLDRFTTNAAAPLTTPRTAEPGPGTGTVTDTGSKMSIAATKLAATSAAAGGDPRMSYGPYARITGRAMWLMGMTWNAASGGAGWANSATPGTYVNIGVGDLSGLIIAVPPSVSAFAPLTVGVTYDILLPLRSNSVGAHIVVKGGVYTDWTRIWVENGISATQFWAIAMQPRNTSLNTTLDGVAVVDLTDAWADDWGTGVRVATPASGVTIVGAADAITEMTWTAATAATMELSIRRTDDDNRWIVRCDQTGSTIKLIERNAGVETERGTAAHTWTNGTLYRVIVWARGAAIRVFVVNSQKFIYSSATFNQTATGVAASGFVTAANLTAWPMNVSLTPNF